MNYSIDVKPDPGRNLRLYKRLVPKIKYKRYPFIIGVKGEYIKLILREIERVTGIESVEYGITKLECKRYYEELLYENSIKVVSLLPADSFNLRLLLEYIAYKSLQVGDKNVSIWGLKVNPNEAVNILQHLINKGNFFTEIQKKSVSKGNKNRKLDEETNYFDKYSVVGSFFLECKSHIVGIEKILKDAFDVIESGFISGSLWNIDKIIQLGRIGIFIELNKSPIIWKWLFQYIRRFGKRSLIDLFIKNIKIMKMLNNWKITLAYFVEICIKRGLDSGNVDISYSAIDLLIKNVFFSNSGNKIKSGKAITPESLYLLSSLKYLTGGDINKEAMETVLSVADVVKRVEFEYKSNELVTCVDYLSLPIRETIEEIIEAVSPFNNDLSILLLLFLLIETNFKDKTIWKKILLVLSDDKIAKKIFKLKFISSDPEMWIAYAQNPQTEYIKRRLILKNYSHLDKNIPFNIANGTSLLKIVKYFNSVLKEFVVTPWNNAKLCDLLRELSKRWERCDSVEAMPFPFAEITKASLGQVEEKISLLLLKNCNMTKSDLEYFNIISKSHKEVQLALFERLLLYNNEDELLYKVDEFVSYSINVDINELLERIAIALDCNNNAVN